MRKEVLVRTAGMTYVVSQNANSVEPGAVLWEVSIIIAKLLDENALDSSTLADRKVLELGAGCAVAGMAYALKGARVTFTDLPALSEHVEANVRRNLGPPGDPYDYRCVPYDWCDGVPATLRGETQGHKRVLPLSPSTSESLSDRWYQKKQSPHETLKRDDHLGPNNEL